MKLSLRLNKKEIVIDVGEEDDYQLIVSMIGFQTYKQEINVKNDNIESLTLFLMTDNKSIAEVDICAMEWSNMF